MLRYVTTTLSVFCTIRFSRSMSTTTTSAASFYRRPLPETCVALASRRGRSMFESATRNKGLKSFFHLMDQHSTQSEPAYCGLSTLVVALNALAVDPRRPWKGPWRWYEEGMLNCCVDLEDVKQTGITIRTFECLALCQGVSVTVNYAEDATLQDFRDAIKTACIEEDTNCEVVGSEAVGEVLEDVLVVSYNRKILGQTGTGHFSPVAAYDSTDDAVLILDTARFKYGSHWVPLPLMFEAMQSKDPDTGKSRGFVLLSHDHCKPASDLPRLLLLRPEMKQSPYRLEYKLFLEQLQATDFNHPKKSITWPEVLSYWTRDGKESNYIWKMTHAQLQPTNAQSVQEGETISAVNAVRQLIAALLPDSSMQSTAAVCQSKQCRTLHLQAIEAIFIVYLASLDEATRRSIVMTPSGFTEAARQQLLDEAELMRIAIDTSDTYQQGIN